MAGIFPAAVDGGIPPNPADPNNPKAAYKPVTSTLTPVLYYGNGCDVRLRPEVINALISEDEAVCDIAQWVYNNARQDNLQMAIRYIAQRGLMSGAVLAGGPDSYYGNLTPPLIYYNDWLTLRLTPSTNCAKAPKASINGLGLVPILRNDGVPLQPNDILAGKPFEVIYYQGNFYYVGLAPSQVPALKSNLVLYVNWWIGNDANDGISNTPEHALKTPQQAVNIAYGYPPSQFTITIIIADAPHYPGFATPYWSGPNISMIGNPANPQNVILTGQNTHACLLSGVNTMTIQGITGTTTLNAAGPGGCFICVNSATLFSYNNRSLYCTGAVFETQSGGNLVIGKHQFAGNCGEMYWSSWNGSLGWIDNDPGNTGTPSGVSDQIIETPITAACTCLVNGGASVVSMGDTPSNPHAIRFINPSYVTGKRYDVSMNGTVSLFGKGPNFFPGTIAGTTSTGGQYA